ncbi:MAG: polysaccharide pyruvyl transferase family protein [Thermoflexibacter sp.]|nr:polysaccharide pyruvyl transferase family protein [Thermoflexibacter sp.]
MHNHIKEVALFGEWDTDNLGDRAIGFNACRFFLGLGYQVKLFNLSMMDYLGLIVTEEEAKRFFNKPSMYMSPTQHTLNTNKSSLSIIKKIKKRLVLPTVRISYRGARNFLNLRYLRRLTKSCSHIIVGGGALLEDLHLYFPTALYFLNKVATNKSVYCLGCSTNDKTMSILGKSLMYNFIHKANLWVRDINSQWFIQKYFKKQAGIFGDFALNIDNDAKKDFTSLPIPLAVNLMKYSGEHEVYQNDYEEFMKVFLANIAQNPIFKITIFTTGSKSDDGIAKKLAEEFGLALCQPNDIDEFSKLLENSSIVVSSRLHAAIMAFSANCYVVGIGIQQKTISFFEFLGIREFCIEDFSSSSAHTLVEKVNEYEKMYEIQSKSIDYEPIRKARQEVKQALSIYE